MRAFSLVELSIALVILGLLTGRTNVFELSGDPLSPEEAWSIDQKLDDGRITSGQILGAKASHTSCATNDDYSTAEYNIPLKEKCCSPMVFLR